MIAKKHFENNSRRGGCRECVTWFVLVEFYEVGDSEGGKFALKIEKVMGFIHLLHQILKIHRPWANST